MKIVQIFIPFLIISFLSCNNDNNPVMYLNKNESKIIFIADNNLCVINKDGTQYQVLAAGTSSIFETDFSFDGTNIVYTSIDGNDKEIYLFNLQTNSNINFSNNDVYDESPVFSPDGKSVLFLSGSNWMYSVFIKNIEHGDTRQLTNKYYSYSPDFSANGEKIIFEINNGGDSTGIVVIDKNGEDAKLIGHGHHPQFSPDGGKILFQDFVQPDGNGLYIMDTDGANRKFLSVIPFQAIPKFSPDGSKIVFANFTTSYEIFIMNIDGGNLINLTNSDNYGEMQPSFSPDGKNIVYVSFDRLSSTSRLCIMDINGKNQKIIAQNIGDIFNPTF